MNIREIAALAKVSPSTVSKILNGKDQDISEATRQRVLRVIKEYQYTPYANIKTLNSRKKINLIALMICDSFFYNVEFLRSIEHTASQNGYNLAICDISPEQPDELKKELKIVLSKNVDAIIFCTHSRSTLKKAVDIVGNKIPFIAVTSFSSDLCVTLQCDFARIAEEAVSLLVEKGHTNIGFILYSSPESVYEQILSGAMHGLLNNSIPINENNFLTFTEGYKPYELDFQKLLNNNVTAAFCQNYDTIALLYAFLARKGIAVPHNFSIICAQKAPINPIHASITAFSFPYREIGENAVKLLIDWIELRQAPKPHSLFFSANLEKGNSIAAPSGSEAPILTIGNCSYDTILSVPHLPATGELLTSTNIVSISGGKCVSQAVAVAKLGGSVYAIGRVGNDSEGHAILKTLNDLSIRSEGIVVDSSNVTGKSYLTVSQDGKHTIVTYPGANRFLDISAIKKLEYLFPSVTSCLVTPEIPASVVKYIIKLCSEYKIKIFYKPSTVIPLGKEFLSKIDYFIPNELEISNLLPDVDSLEEKAAYFLESGCKNVIVTLGERGCYLKNREYDIYIPAADFKAVETTSAANCFIGALAVSLAKGNNLLYAISYATYAAGLSVTNYGMHASFPYKQQMDMYLDDINDFYLRILERCQKKKTE